uniref:Major capsid protein N-terminal domain-containing protein n=1 Tax=viral metagenome TaxID=1070528 RepID=A0A6C0HGC0_9ZZZZ
MGGGLLQLVAYGAQDAYISGNPQITFWKGLYKRHTNFAMEPFRINFNGEPNWGTRQTAIINRYADLLFSTYVQLELPTNNLAGSPAEWNHGTTKDGYQNGIFSPLGFNFIDRVELDIGGQIIDRLYSEYMYLWSSLTHDYDKRNKLSEMLTNEKYTISTLQFNANPGCTGGNGRQSLPNVLYIPLTFFFTKNPGTALPLIALQYHEVKINVIWKSPEAIAGNYTTGIQTLPQATSASLYIDYIYLDTDERRRFAQQSHEYLIEQVQFNEDVGISSASKRIDLTFNHPVKELLWVVQPTCYTNCKAERTNYRANPTNAAQNRLTPYVYDVPAVFEQHLQINGQDRLERRYGDYFNKVQSYQHHTGVAPGFGVYMYSFAVKPEEHQPSGTCNFSRIDTATLVVTMDGGVTVDQGQGDVWDMRMYAINYNVLRIMSGMGGLAFSN